MKFDKAYCLSLADKLSIYDVRELNFDETLAFDSTHEHFLCPDDACRAAFPQSNVLGTFNARNVNYVRTPHFKNLPATLHREGCPYGQRKNSAAEEENREEHFPSELLLTRRQYSLSPTPANPPAALPPLPRPAEPQERSPAPDKTSVFAHPVECFVSNIGDKDLLKRMPLKIGEQTATYWTFFKKVEYLQDNKGLIYWGRIKEIKDYTSSFRIDFEKKVWADKKPHSVNIYLSKRLIEGYRKRKAFLEEIKYAIDSQRELYCFFYGVTPQLKQVPSKKNPQQTFAVFSADIDNLDHLIIREVPGLERS